MHVGHSTFQHPLTKIPRSNAPPPSGFEKMAQNAKEKQADPIAPSDRATISPEAIAAAEKPEETDAAVVTEEKLKGRLNAITRGNGYKVGLLAKLTSEGVSNESITVALQRYAQNHPSPRPDLASLAGPPPASEEYTILDNPLHTESPPASEESTVLEEVIHSEQIHDATSPPYIGETLNPPLTEVEPPTETAPSSENPQSETQVSFPQ